MTGPVHTRFDGWVMVFQHGPGELLTTEITAIDWDRQSPGLNVPNCETQHDIERGSCYELVNPQEVSYLCAVCVLELVENAANRPDYVIGEQLAD